MKPHAPFAVAALAGAIALANAAPPPNEPAATWPKLDVNTQEQEPVATTRTGGPDEDLANTIAQALNADESMKHAKITVQPEKDSVLLTGVALNNAQRKRAGEIAAQGAGERGVVNAIQSSELTVDQTGGQEQQAPATQDQPTSQPAN